MSRKTIIWIVGGVLAAAVVAVVGIVSYRLGSLTEPVVAPAA